MKKEEISVGNSYQCQVKEDMEAPFVGHVDKVYENSALLTITDYNSQADQLNVEELNHRIVVNFKQFIKPETSVEAEEK
ncbi:DUF2187 domain-containing protein [Agrilactobacillus fermenti]|uniref:DUF2187 domain-containing protein n=1 Tax=Agrilactobacillus fermenti TaxID=2586909 RepID=UPI001E2BF5CB|nr:DUF2187 domain-containing protein [Agrilactobacillus fermenti]MCD2256810.1 DUF2187 domain-containing protein [Agrilactobacillus fermenti]